MSPTGVHLNESGLAPLKSIYGRLGGKGVNFGICLSALGVSYVTSNDEAVVK